MPVSKIKRSVMAKIKLKDFLTEKCDCTNKVKNLILSRQGRQAQSFLVYLSTSHKKKKNEKKAIRRWVKNNKREWYEKLWKTLCKCEESCEVKISLKFKIPLTKEESRDHDYLVHELESYDEFLRISQQRYHREDSSGLRDHPLSKEEEERLDMYTDKLERFQESYEGAVKLALEEFKRRRSSK